MQAQILISDDHTQLPINLAFLGLDVLGVHLKKSDEWLYGIYREDKLLGYLYEGHVMSKEDQDLYARRLMPQPLKSIEYYKKEYKGKVGYYFSYAENYALVGFLENKNIIMKHQNI